jgi:hypothetical protein
VKMLDALRRIEPSAPDEELRAARPRFARACSEWTEIPDDLVEQSHGFHHVSAETDKVYELGSGRKPCK